MKAFNLLLISFLFQGALLAETPDIRSRIGSTFSAPVSYQGKIYFVATTGVLYESDLKFTTVTKLYEGQRQTIGSLIIVNDKLYWGDGMHLDNKSALHTFDLKTRKMLKDIELEGHIERAPLFQSGNLYLPLGPGGVSAIDPKTSKVLWNTKKHEGKNLHVDSNLLAIGNKICGTTVYETKGVVCFEAKTGKVTQLSTLSRNPKSEITQWKNNVVGFSTEGDLTQPKWDLPADLYIYDVQNDKIKFVKELRGFNFFAPSIKDDEAFITLSTGDFIIMNLNDGKIQFLGEFPEPFTNNAFMRNADYCGIGIMGKYLCYTKTKNGFALSTDKRLMETIIGKVIFMDGKLVAPSRIGYFIE